MKSSNLVIFSIITVLLVSVAFASQGQQKRDFSLSSNAKEIAPGLYSLGQILDNKGDVLEGYAIVHYKNGFLNGKTNQATSGNSCYSFMARGAKWKSIEPWEVNPSNSRGLDSNFILNNIAGDIQKWENAAGKNIIGNGIITTDTLVADTQSPDNQNEIYFADIQDPNAIAVTIVWGIFSGPIPQRKLVEWDQVYDDVDYDWSSSGESGKMDFENIATHEIGHGFGLGDLYTLGCSEQTMYGYASEGETKKRTLASGDITGIKNLYS